MCIDTSDKLDMPRYCEEIMLQLGARIVAHYHRTGDALVPMLQMQDALTGSKVDGLETCAPAMMLARLLQVERDSLSTRPALTRSKLLQLKAFWSKLQREGFAAEALAWVNASRAPTTGSLREAPSADWLNVTSASIRQSFERIDAQVKQLASLAMLRRKIGFKVNVVMPFCARADEQYLKPLESLVLQVWKPQ
ncbi:unnamed protein product [Symbiodinium natans]|uniref:Uncharacterized protein n=1 Tax=Symbiodinium natans TaxID=878477 RepID=A0A812RPE2_9DINO|nr:unnamed protein product [Symbiodinium natans]